MVVVVEVLEELNTRALETGHSYRGQQKPWIDSWRHPNIGGGQLCCKQIISLRKQKQKSHGSSLGICCAETYNFPRYLHVPGPNEPSSSSSYSVSVGNDSSSPGR